VTRPAGRIAMLGGDALRVGDALPDRVALVGGDALPGRVALTPLDGFCILLF